MFRKLATFFRLFGFWASVIIAIFLLLTSGCQPSVNRPPEIIEGIVLPVGVPRVGEKIQLQLGSVNDPDGDALVYSWRAFRGKMEPSSPSRDPQATYTAPALPGEDTITVIVSDGKSGTASDSIRFYVVAEPHIPPTPIRLIKITEPAEGAIVPGEIAVRGTFLDLPPGSTIWAVVYIDGLYWPQGQATQFWIGDMPAWQATAYIGGEEDSGKQFEVFAILADEATDTMFTEWLRSGEITGKYPGLPMLPEGATICDKSTVTRR